MLIAVVLALAGAAMNATASVCQRHESREEPDRSGSILRMLLDLAARPIWWLGVVAMISGFGLEAAALALGRIAVVEPVMIVELPLTVLGARLFLGRRLNRTGWFALLGLAGAVALFVGALAPQGGDPTAVRLVTWAIVGGLTAAFAVVCAVLAARWRRPRAALLGVATGTAFALMSVLISAVGAIYGAGGFTALLTSWQTYAAIVVGPSSFFLLQYALQAGSLVASQPGFTLVNPLVSVLWGVLVFGETVRPGVWLGVAGLAAVAVVVATLLLVRGAEQDQPDAGSDSPGDSQRSGATAGSTSQQS
jgi:drug/metabolite transporter (DMT)-like permease